MSPYTIKQQQELPTGFKCRKLEISKEKVTCNFSFFFEHFLRGPDCVGIFSLWLYTFPAEALICVKEKDI